MTVRELCMAIASVVAGGGGGAKLEGSFVVEL